MMITNMSEAIEQAKVEINRRTNSNVISTIPVHNGKHAILVTDMDIKYYLLFKKNFFMSFGKIFPNFKGIGESINKDALEYAISSGCHTILIIYSDGKVYSVPPEHWKRFAEENNTIRITDSNEITMSVPINQLRRW